jgi:hypothetical protein
MSSKPPITVIACKVFQGLLEKHLPASLADQVNYLDYGLHQVPRKLKTALQEAIDAIPEPSLVVLGYGLCGNGLDGLKSGRHTLLIPRADDCIALLLGSNEAYQEQFSAMPGTYWLSKGWLEAGSNPMVEYQGYVEKYGKSQADWLVNIQYQNYKRLAFVSHGPEDLATYRPMAQKVAEFCARWGMEYEEILGSEDYIRRLGEVAADLGKADGEFILIPPGGVLKQASFLR